MPSTRPLLLALAIGLFGATTAPAQGLGGMLGQARAKASQAVSSPVAAATSAAPSALPANGEDPPTPPEMTPETQAEYTRLLLSEGVGKRKRYVNLLNVTRRLCY